MALAKVRPCKCLNSILLSTNLSTFARHQGRHKKLAWFSVAVHSIEGKVNYLGTVNLLTDRGGQPIFYMRVGRLMRLATKIVKAAGIVTRNRKFEWTKCASRYKLVNGENVTCHGIFYYLQCGKPNSFSPLRIFANGQAVWLVAASPGSGEFFAGPGKGHGVFPSR